MSRNSGRVYIIGAGLAGLASAVALAKKNIPVSIYEAAGLAGGRCRSFFDDTLGMVIDNGNHLILGANRNTMRYLELTGSFSPEKIRMIGDPLILRDIHSRSEHHVSGLRPVSGFSVFDHLPLLPMLMFPGSRTVASFFDASDPFYQRVIVPLCVSALNTEPEAASAKLFAKTLMVYLRPVKSGHRFCLPANSLSDALVDGASTFLKQSGNTIRYTTSLKKLEVQNGRITALQFAAERVALDEGDRVILAVPSWALETLSPELAVDLTYKPIVNGHFSLDTTVHTLRRDFIGLIGRKAHWLFFKNGLLSTTTSAADDMLGLSHDDIAQQLWDDVYQTLHTVPKTPPPYRIIVEKRAAFFASPDNDAKRPQAQTRFSNCFLAGDYVQTGMPATIESAITSGFTAANICIGGMRG